MAKQLRTQLVTVRFKPEEVMRIEAKAEEIGVDRSTFIRMATLEKLADFPEKKHVTSVHE